MTYAIWPIRLYYTVNAGKCRQILSTPGGLVTSQKLRIILSPRLLQKEGCLPMPGRGKTEFRGTVLIADDHEVFRIGLVHLLRRSLKVKRFLQAQCFAQVLDHLNDQDVTLTILDLRMPGLEGPEDIEIGRAHV